MNLDTSLVNIKGIGNARAKSFAKMGISEARDLLMYFPRRYEYRGDVKKLFDVQCGIPASVILRIDSSAKEAYGKNGLFFVKVNASDDTGGVTMTFFNNRWIAPSLTIGRLFRVYGKFNLGLYGREITNPVIEPYSPSMQSVYPIYTVTGNITQKIISDTVKAVISASDEIAETLPEEIRKKYDLSEKSAAIKSIHFPKDEAEVNRAVRALAFEELTVFQLSIRKMRTNQTEKQGLPLSLKNSGIRTFFGSLPFSLTNAQQRTVKEIFADMQKQVPMMRLVQGDVGSGKTVVAVAAAYLCVKNGYQASVMAPTEILATQHYATFEKMLSPFGIKVLLIVGSMSAAKKSEAKKLIASGEADVVIGTNAVIQSDVEFKNLALAVTDEQHRFGVMQRASLINKGIEGKTPHTLVMSATPIPRTLSLILYGDLDISIIDELPPGRQKVITRAVPGEDREKVNSFLKSEKENGHQIFVVCPLVEESEKIEAESAVSRFEEIKKELPSFRCGLLHGKMKASEKQAVMESFRKKELDLLVSTTVIEVGVDIPNATVMVVENAERFGLSTLHQLRGRIGRGKEKSYCVLIYDKQTEKAKERLETMCRTDDGFEIAKTDLKLRGPGDFFGERQSGEMRFRTASLADLTLVEQTRLVVDNILENNLLEKPEYSALNEAAENMWLKNIRENTLN